MQSRVVLHGSRISQRDELLYTAATGLVQYKPFTFYHQSVIDDVRVGALHKAITISYRQSIFWFTWRVVLADFLLEEHTVNADCALLFEWLRPATCRNRQGLLQKVSFFKMTVHHHAIGPLDSWENRRDGLGTATAFAMQSRLSSK